MSTPRTTNDKDTTNSDATTTSSKHTNNPKETRCTHTYTYSKELGRRLLKIAKDLATKRETTGEDVGGRRHGRNGICEENDAICKNGTLPNSNGGTVIQVLPPHHILQPAERWRVGESKLPTDDEAPSITSLLYPVTEITVVNLDTISAALALMESVLPPSPDGGSTDDGGVSTIINQKVNFNNHHNNNNNFNNHHNNSCVALSFANDTIPGGYYRAGGAQAQEEDLCCTIPELYWTLCSERSLNYPILPGTALLSRDLFVVRSPTTNYPLLKALLMPPIRDGDLRGSDGGGGEEGAQDEDHTYSNLVFKSVPRLSIVTAAMPRGLGGKRPPGGFLNPSSEWHKTVSLRIQSVLLASKASGKKDLVLGAFGAGAFGNPPKYVAEVFKEVLCQEQFIGCFHRVVFAIIDPMGTGNLKPFLDAFSTWESSSRQKESEEQARRSVGALSNCSCS